MAIQKVIIKLIQDAEGQYGIDIDRFSVPTSIEEGDIVLWSFAVDIAGIASQSPATAYITFNTGNPFDSTTTEYQLADGADPGAISFSLRADATDEASDKLNRPVAYKYSIRITRPDDPTTDAAILDPNVMVRRKKHGSST